MIGCAMVFGVLKLVALVVIDILWIVGVIPAPWWLGTLLIIYTVIYLVAIVSVVG